MASQEWRILTIDEQLQPEIERRLGQAVDYLKGEGRPLTYSNVVREVISSPVWDQVNWLFSFPFNEKTLFAYLKKQKDRYGILLFSEELGKHLDIEPREITERLFREDLGYFVIRHLPETYQRIFSAEKRPVFYRADICERGIVGFLVLDHEQMVVKTTLSDEETQIAKQLGEKGLSPRVFEGTRDVLAEELITDPPVREFIAEPDFVGECMGRILRAVHEEGIVYNNRLYDHVRVGVRKPLRPRVRLIDFESAHRGNDFQSDWTDARYELETIIYPDDFQKRAAALSSLEKWREG